MDAPDALLVALSDRDLALMIKALRHARSAFGDAEVYEAMTALAATFIRELGERVARERSI